MKSTKERSVNEGEDERGARGYYLQACKLAKTKSPTKNNEEKKIFTYLCNESVPSRNCVSTRQRQRLQGNVHQCGRPRSEFTDNSISIYLPCLTNLPTWKEHEFPNVEGTGVQCKNNLQQNLKMQSPKDGRSQHRTEGGPSGPKWAQVDPGVPKWTLVDPGATR